MDFLATCAESEDGFQKFHEVAYLMKEADVGIGHGDRPYP